VIFIAGSARATLQSAKNCGIPTGGREECYFDCQIVSSAQGSGQLIKDLTCLRDCFSSEESADDFCISSLLNDVIKDGVCDLTDEYGYNPGPGIYKPVKECEMGVVASSYGFDQNVIDVGTCSSVTEGLLSTEQCRREIMEEQGFIQNTLLQLVQNSCNHTVSEFYVTFMQGNLGRRKRGVEEPQLNSRVKRLAPAQVIYGSHNIRTVLDFENTQNRYSWICSLQSTASSAEHLCAVNILSLPPSTTVIVGAAHCTFLCKAKSRQVSPCCCSSGPGNCAANKTLCGDKPGVVEMRAEDASIVCGRWKYNKPEDKEIVLNIKEIVRHPKYDNDKGPISGADLVVFKVNDKPLKQRTATARKLNPACLPTNDKQPSSGIHAGWSKPPPRSYIKTHASEYEQFYEDFFKQWHYKMDILDKCEDPKKNSITGEALQFPSNSSYPAATLCAKDFSKQSCFSQGESGSPLMVESKERFSIEGLLSFVKGCDVFTFGTTDAEKNNAQLNQQTENPTTYTKLSCFLPWIAEQYGMEYEGSGQEDQACLVASGGNPDSRNEVCRNTPSNLVELFSGEVECIFPFYYKDKKYDGCILFEEDGFVYPVFRCPTRDITTKIDGINSFEFLPLVDGYCPTDSTDSTSPLDPSITDCSPFARRAPFSQCKNNCPGVQALGIIGG